MSTSTEVFDLSDIDDLIDDFRQPELAADEEPKQQQSTSQSQFIIFDIETGPRPWSEIETFYEPPPAMPPWDDSMVKYGNTKDAAKRKEKYDAVKAEYTAALAAEADTREQHRCEWAAKAALSPITGRVLAIGYQRVGDDAVVCGNDDEKIVLRNFWEVVHEAVQAKDRLIGFNSNGFDLPFLIRRSWLLDVDVPDGVMVGRYFSPTFVDLMQLWACGGRDFISLKDVSTYFGTAQKIGDGADFAGLWNCKETRQQAVEYLKQDLRVTVEVARKMGVC